MERKTEIPIVMVFDKRRMDLVKQTLISLVANDPGVPFDLHVTEDKVGDSDNYIKQRNRLMKNLTGYKYVCYVDDDLYFKKGWLKLLVEMLEKHKDIGVVGGFRHFRQKVEEERDDINIHEVVITGSCMLFRGELWEKIGSWKVGVRKTYDVCEAVKKEGWKLGALRDNTWVLHCGLNSLITKKGFADYTIANMAKQAAKVGAILQ